MPARECKLSNDAYARAAADPSGGEESFVPSHPVVQDALATIRHFESGDYNSNPQHANGATASGAYQIIDSTWQAWAAGSGVNGATQYARAYQAPPAIQDAVAGWRVAQILNAAPVDTPLVPGPPTAQYLSGAKRISSVPISWFYPVALTDCDAFNSKPAGNPITVKAYAERWVAYFKTLPGWKKYEDAGEVVTLGPSPAEQLVPGITGLTDAVVAIGKAVAKTAAWVANPANWLRILEVLGGAGLLVIGIQMLANDLGVTAAVAKTVAAVA